MKSQSDLVLQWNPGFGNYDTYWLFNDGGTRRWIRESADPAQAAAFADLTLNPGQAFWYQRKKDLHSTVTLTVGIHDIDLIVTDNDGATSTDRVSIVVSSPANQPPVAAAGPDQTLTDSDGNGTETVPLNATSSSDPHGSIVSVLWSLNGAPLATTLITTPSLPVGTHTIDLRVTDDDGATDIDSLVVAILPQANTPPIADAGPDQFVVDVQGDGGDTIVFNSSGSSDSDGTITSFDWVFNVDLLFRRGMDDLILACERLQIPFSDRTAKGEWRMPQGSPSST